MDMTENKDYIVEKKVYEDGKREYASKGLGNAGLTLGIIGTALGAGAWLCGGNRSVFGSLGGGNMPENVNINAYGNGAGNSNSPYRFAGTGEGEVFLKVSLYLFTEEGEKYEHSEY